jgi:iron complex transport system ATP-binding protein
VTLAAERLEIGYFGRTVASDITLELEPGEVLCLLGPNGGGKTTLFRTLLGLIRARGGRVLLDGKDLAHWSRREVAARIAYVPQAQQSLFPFTVHEMVVMGCTARLGAFAQPSAADHAVADEALQTLGIDHLAARPVTEISGGERQMTLIARALAQQSTIVVMDEPTASLDFGNQVRVLEQIRRLADGGKSIVLSTHDPDHALLCGDRVALLHGGRLVALGPTDETVTAANLKRIYGVDVVVAYVPELGRRACSPSLAFGAAQPTDSPQRLSVEPAR